MNRYIKFAALLSVIALVLAACGPGASTTTTAASGIGEGRLIGMAFDIGGRGDASFNDLAALAWDEGKAQYGFTGQELAPDATGSNREQNLELLAETGHELIIANGFAFSQNAWRVGTAFPEVRIAITDECPADDTFAPVEMPNVRCMLFSEEQGSFLVGAAAALKSTTGVIGFIGGVEIDLIKKFEAGFIAGAKHVKADITILPSTYLTQVPDFSGFNDPVRGREAALALYQAGADVVYHAAGGSGLGLFRAAREVSESTNSKVWAIGVDADQYNSIAQAAGVAEGEAAVLREYILTSMLKRVDVAVSTAIEDFLNDRFTPGIKRLGLAEDGIGFSTSGGFIDDIADQLNGLRDEIIAGTITVPTTP